MTAKKHNKNNNSSENRMESLFTDHKVAGRRRKLTITIVILVVLVLALLVGAFFILNTLSAQNDLESLDTSAIQEESVNDQVTADVIRPNIVALVGLNLSQAENNLQASYKLAGVTPVKADPKKAVAPQTVLKTASLVPLELPKEQNAAITLELGQNDFVLSATFSADPKTMGVENSQDFKSLLTLANIKGFVQSVGVTPQDINFKGADQKSYTTYEKQKVSKKKAKKNSKKKKTATKKIIAKEAIALSGEVASSNGFKWSMSITYDYAAKNASKGKKPVNKIITIKVF